MRSPVSPDSFYEMFGIFNIQNLIDLFGVRLSFLHFFPKSAMDNGKTTQKGWGNAIILSPTGEEIKYNTISYDLYSSLKEALDPTWDLDLEAPDMTKITEAEGHRRASVVYRIVYVVNNAN